MIRALIEWCHCDALLFTLACANTAKLRLPRADAGLKAAALHLMTRVGRLRIECDHRLRQSGTFLPIVVHFRAASAKMNNRKWGSTMLPQANISLKRPLRNSC